MTSPSKRPRILLADDQRDVLEALRLLLKNEGFDTEAVASPAAAIEALRAREFDAALVDLNYARDTTSGQEGLDLLAHAQALDASLPVIVMTAWGSVDLAVEAMRRGARDFIQKPWDNDRLVTILRTQVELSAALRMSHRLLAENVLLQEEGRPQVIAESPAMMRLLELVARIAPSDASVLITGEHGTGKGVIARLVHSRSARSQRPLVTVNAGGLSEGVLESELFGHVRGAFTDAKTDRAGRFELADGGTLFLDEIGNVPIDQQARLLRVIETGEFERVGSSRTQRTDARLVAATNVDLGAKVSEGRFREDLLFRINTIELALPPLRERREDIAPLAQHFLDLHGRKRRGAGPIALTPDALSALLAHSWPGNVRELSHAIERAVLVGSGDVLRVSDLGLKPSSREPARRIEDLGLEEVERMLIEKALARHEGSVLEAARALGLSRSALYRRLSKHGL